MDSPLPRKRALILDDDRTVGNTLGMILSSRYDVRVAPTAEDVINLIAEWIPDVAIVDILLPGMNGVDFALLLQRTCPGCCVLLFTGLPGIIGEVESARADGHVFEVLEKPIAPLFMLDRIADTLAAGPAARLQ